MLPLLLHPIPTIVILQSDNVIFTEVAAVLNLNNGEGIGSAILDPVRCPYRHEGRFLG
jgi:hypothetical protein